MEDVYDLLGIISSIKHINYIELTEKIGDIALSRVLNGNPTIVLLSTHGKNEEKIFLFAINAHRSNVKKNWDLMPPTIETIHAGSF